jgi:uncharacterized sulfatase
MCEWFDETCGQLVQLLEDHETMENTIIIYVCDNGWIQDPASSRFAPRSKQTPYEGGVRTPIFYHWPGHIPSADRSELATSLDIFPTILSIAGAEIPDDLPGRNLFPNLIENTPIERDRIFGEQFAHDIADINDGRRSLLFRWCIQGRWKLLIPYDGEANRYANTNPDRERSPQLFDLLDDPFETQNLAAMKPDLVRQLQTKIEAEFDEKPETQE